MKEAGLADGLSKNLDKNFERLVRAYEDRMYSFARRLTDHAQDAEDLTQEGFVRAYRAMKSYPPERIRAMDLKPWLYRIVLNVFRNRVRKKAPCALPMDKGEKASRSVWDGERRADPSAAAEDSETRRFLGKAIASLPKKYRLAVVLRYVEGLDYATMQGILGGPEGTLKTNVHRGLLLLRQKMGGEGKGRKG